MQLPPRALSLYFYIYILVSQQEKSFPSSRFLRLLSLKIEQCELKDGLLRGYVDLRLGIIEILSWRNLGDGDWLCCVRRVRASGMLSMYLVPEAHQQQAAICAEDTRGSEGLLLGGLLHSMPKSQLQAQQDLRLVPPRATHGQLRRLPGRRAPASVLQVFNDSVLLNKTFS